MKLVAKILLIILTPILIFFCAVSINIRAQLLSVDFWKSAFENGNVYSKISETMGEKLLSKVLESGGKKSDIGDLSSLISAGSLRNFTEKNIDGVLLYANGKSEQLMVYAPIPSENLPDSLNIKDLDGYSKVVPIEKLLNEYNITGITKENFNFVSKLGLLSWFFVGVSYLLLILDFVCLYLLSPVGKRMVSYGIALGLSGIVFLASYLVGNFVLEILNVRYIESTNLGTLFVTIITPPIVTKVIQIWLWFGIFSLFLGILLFFVRKPATNKMK